jgi:4-diphosphocytidyl-2-C-methyl-D-erythritol kinase
MIQKKAYAKINLFLDIIGINGSLHEMKMIMQTIDLYDILTFQKKKELEITINTDNKILKTDNIIIKAFNALKELYPAHIVHGYNIDLIKNIPLGAGLGGGSSNAATAIKIFLEDFNLKLSKIELNKILLSIGSDVPFCFYGGTKLVQGKGEIIDPISLYVPKYILVVYPNIHISTKEAFFDWDIYVQKNNYQASGNILEQHFYNAFELSVFPKFPVIQSIKEKLLKLKATNALMTGSGSTVFATFEDLASIQNAYEEFVENYQCFITEPI